MFEAQAASRVISDWGWLQKYNILPKAGGLLEQDPKWVEAIELIGGEMARMEKAQNG